MGHLLNAIIARGPIAEAKAVERGLPVIFEGDFVIVPIHWDVLMELSRDDEPADGSAMNMFNTHVPHLLASELGMDPYVLIETCYHGGIGEQHASSPGRMDTNCATYRSIQHCARSASIGRHHTRIRYRKKLVLTFGTGWKIGGRGDAT
ncbi:MAG: hypothetical protein IPO05_09820 [Flavobacteriales bacterium]|nr:hypothetical protein [Flavobacteriales bacterium]